MGVSASARKTPQVSGYAKNRGFEHAKNALQSFANSSKPEIDTLQFPNPQKCLPKSPKVTKRHPKFRNSQKKRGLLYSKKLESPFIAPKSGVPPHPTTPPSAPSRHRAVKSAV